MAKRCNFYSECHQFANTEISYSKLPLCTDHFIQYLENSVWKTIQKHNLIEINSKERLLVAVSGGKDSQALISILSHLLHKRIPMDAVYIELGIHPNDYSLISQKNAKKICDLHDIPLHILNINEMFGFSLDDIHGLIKAEEKQSSDQETIRQECSYCGLIKRYLLNKFAVDNQYTKVATGHNLTDEAATCFHNFLNMNLPLLARTSPLLDTDNPGFVPRIKPLYNIPEQDIMLYTYFLNLPHATVECPYSQDTPTTFYRDLVNKIDDYQNGASFFFMRQFQSQLQPLLKEKTSFAETDLNLCEICKMPTLKPVCPFCRTVEQVKEDLKNLKT